jgi:hypothetical protein
MEVSANVSRTEPTPRREQDGETYSAATRSRSTSTQPIAAPSTATHTSCSRIARATRSAAPRVAHPSASSLDIAGTASARMARRRILASASSSAASARRICIKSLPRGRTTKLTCPARTRGYASRKAVMRAGSGAAPGSACLPGASAATSGLFLLLRLCIEKVVHHRDDDGHALHQRDVCCVGQYGQSRW